MPRPARNAALASASCLVLLSLLAAVVLASDRIEHGDAIALHWFAQYEGSQIGTLASIITFFAEPVPLLIVIGAAALAALRRGERLEVAAALVTVLGANLTTQALKHALAHPRVQAILENPPDLTTFPSGHVTGAVTLVIALAWLLPAGWRRRVGAWGSVYVLAVGISVLILEWHFPTDVLGAILVALAWGFGVLAVYLWLRGGRPGSRVPRRDWAAGRASGDSSVMGPAPAADGAGVRNAGAGAGLSENR